MKTALVSLAVGTLTLSALAAPPPFYIAGDFNGWNATGQLMSETTAGSGIWQAVVQTTPGRHEFKFTGGDWTWSYPGANSWLYAPASGLVTISYDTNPYADGWQSSSQRIGLSADPGAWTAAGDFEGWNNAAGNMTALGGGIYAYQQVLTPGAHSWKAVVTGSWDSISFDTRSVGTGNYDFTVVPGAELCTFYVDALRGVVKLDMNPVPEPSSLALMVCAAAAAWAWRRP